MEALTPLWLSLGTKLNLSYKVGKASQWKLLEKDKLNYSHKNGRGSTNENSFLLDLL